MSSPGRRTTDHRIVSAGGFRGPILSLSELMKAPVTARVMQALQHGNKTLQEIERWGRFDGETAPAAADCLRHHRQARGTSRGQAMPKKMEIDTALPCRA